MPEPLSKQYMSMGSGAPSAVLLKVDLDGNEIWNKIIGEKGMGNTFWHVMEGSDGGYFMAGDTHLGVLPGTQEDIHGALMVKTDADGEILWQHIVGRVTRYGEAYLDMLWLKTGCKGY